MIFGIYLETGGLYWVSNYFCPQTFCVGVCMDSFLGPGYLP